MKNNKPSNAIGKVRKNSINRYRISLLKVISLIYRNNFLILIILIGSILRIYHIEQLMSFIGDQGWFYLSARDMVLGKNFPLVGIPSSHPWLHQGPLWTYILALIFKIFGFNPVNGAYFVIIVGIITNILIYFVGKIMFTKKVGLIAALIFASSPIVVINSRMAYHTSPIPLVVLMFLVFLYKWIKGDVRFFPYCVLSIVLLYNFELASAPFIIFFFCIFIYGLIKKEKWILDLLRPKIIFFSMLYFFLPMMPILVYDYYNGFPQTFGFGIWIFYMLIKPLLPLFGILVRTSSDSNFLAFLNEYMKKLFFNLSGFVSLVFLVVSVVYLIKKSITTYFTNTKNINYILLLLIFLFSTLGIMLPRTPSDAYLLLHFPLAILIAAVFFGQMMNTKSLNIIVTVVLVIVAFINIKTLLYNNFYSGKKNFQDRVNVVNKFVKELNGRKYNLVGGGWLGDFNNNTKNYEYLAWMAGNPPVSGNKEIKVIIYEGEFGSKYEIRQSKKN